MFLTILPLLFTYTDFISQSQAMIVGIMLWLLVDSLTARPPEVFEFRTPSSLYLFLHATWLGQARLSQAFWPFFVILNASLFYIDYRIEQDTYTVASWQTVHMMLAMPLIYWMVSVWRCSDKCTRKIWAVSARVMTFLAIAEFYLRWVVVENFPRIFFTCREIIIQWGDC